MASYEQSATSEHYSSKPKKKKAPAPSPATPPAPAKPTKPSFNLRTDISGPSQVKNLREAAGMYFGSDGPIPTEDPILSSDPTIARGQAVGIQRGAQLYGQGQGQTGADIQDIVRRRREALEGGDPASTQIRQSANRQIRAARASGGAGGYSSQDQEAQIRRRAEQDISTAMYGEQERQLNKYQRLMGSIAANQSAMEMGFGGLEKSGQYEPPPAPKGGVLGGTVICTELHRQGYMSDDILEKDTEYGSVLRSTRPHVYSGYRFLADPVVTKMKKYPLFAKVVSIPALAWAKNMAGESNLFGAAISLVGEAICGIIGKCLKETSDEIWI